MTLSEHCCAQLPAPAVNAHVGDNWHYHNVKCECAGFSKSGRFHILHTHTLFISVPECRPKYFIGQIVPYTVGLEFKLKN
jgi:hypothetical protein